MRWHGTRPIRWRFLWATTAGCGARRTRSVRAGRSARRTDASHFQNLNGGLGSLAEVESLSRDHDHALHDDGRPGRERNGGREEQYGQCRLAADSSGGYGGPVAIDPINSSNWYVNNQAGVSIYRCAQSAAARPRILARVRWSAMRTWAEMGTPCRRRRHFWWIRWTRPVAGGNLPGVARAGDGGGWSGDQRDQPDSRQRVGKRHVQRRCADSLDGRAGAAGRREGFTWACTVLQAVAQTWLAMC